MSGDDEGASPGERLIGACRANNVELLDEAFASVTPRQSEEHPDCSPKEIAVADLINNTKSSMGDYPLHVAALRGSWDVIDVITEQDLVEMDPRARSDGAYPLHRAVEYANNEMQDAGLDTESVSDAIERGYEISKLLLEAGCDPRLKNKMGEKAIDILDSRIAKVRAILLMAENANEKNDDVIDEDNRSEGGDGPPSDDDE